MKNNTVWVSFFISICYLMVITISSGQSVLFKGLFGKESETTKVAMLGVSIIDGNTYQVTYSDMKSCYEFKMGTKVVFEAVLRKLNKENYLFIKSRDRSTLGFYQVYKIDVSSVGYIVWPCVYLDFKNAFEKKLIDGKIHKKEIYEPFALKKKEVDDYLVISSWKNTFLQKISDSKNMTFFKYKKPSVFLHTWKKSPE